MLDSLTGALCTATGPLLFLGLWEESLRLSRRAYEAALPSGNRNRAGLYAYSMAWLLYLRAETAEATLWADRCADVWTQEGSKHQQSTALRIRGLVAFQRGEHDHAEKLLQDTLAIDRALNLTDNIMVLLADLAILERDRGRYDAAAHYLSEALQLLEKSRSTESMAALYRDMGALALDRKRWAEAREWVEKALPLTREVGRHDLIANAQTLLARAHEAEGNIHLALPLVHEALAVELKLRSKNLSKTRDLFERLRERSDAPESSA